MSAKQFAPTSTGPLGAYRTRTTEFNRLRDAARASSRPFGASDDKSKANDASKLLSAAFDSHGGDGFGATGIGMPPVWAAVSDEVTNTMNRIQERLVELSQCHSKALLPNFDEFSGEEQQAEVLTQEITRLFKRCEKSLRILQDIASPDANDKKIRMNMSRNYAAQLQKLSVDFRKRQKDYLTKLKALQDRGPGGDVFGDLDGGGNEDYDPGFNEIQLQRTNTMVDTSQERDQEVVKIVESINELAQIMKDLSVLVIDQGTIVDRIDYNIQTTAAAIDEGVKQIEKANETQKAGWMFMVIMCLGVLVILMFLVLFAKEAIMG